MDNGSLDDKGTQGQDGQWKVNVSSGQDPLEAASDLKGNRSTGERICSCYTGRVENIGLEKEM